MLMPKPDADVLAKRERVVAALRAIVPGEGVIADEDELRAYECDALTAYQAVPMAVVLQAYRAALLGGGAVDAAALALISLAAAGLLLAGYRLFMRTSYHFAEEL